MTAFMVNINRKKKNQIFHDGSNISKVFAEMAPKVLTYKENGNVKNIWSDIMERLIEEPNLRQM